MSPSLISLLRFAVAVVVGVAVVVAAVSVTFKVWRLLTSGSVEIALVVVVSKVFHPSLSIPYYFSARRANIHLTIFLT
jgi:hypothetical protein